MKIKKHLVLWLISFNSLAIVHGDYIHEKSNTAIKRLVLVPKGEEFSEGNLNFYGRCTGEAISNSELLTAGHCVVNEDGEFTPYIVEMDDTGIVRTIAPVKMETDFVPEEVVINYADKKYEVVPGCSPGIKPLQETKSLDLALLKFTTGTFDKWFSLETNFVREIDIEVLLFGFGSQKSSFEGSYLPSRIHTRDLGFTSALIKRFSYTRMATIAFPAQGFADVGDSGGAVVLNNKLLGILNTVEEKCETEFGDDYGFINSFTDLTHEKVKTWLNEKRK